MAESFMARLVSLSLCFSMLAASWHRSAALYSSDGAVLLLEDDAFKNDVLEGTDPWLVDFYQDNCKPCMEFAPEFTKAATGLKGLLKTGAIDCSKHQQTCFAAGIKALPAVKFYSWERKKNPYTGKWYKDPPADYSGEMRAKKLTEFATSHLPGSFVHNITSGSSAKSFFSERSNLAKVVLFSAKEGVTPLYKALSLRLRGRLQFAQAKSTDAKLCEQFGVEQFPSIYVQKVSGEREKYEGLLKVEPILHFLEPFAAEGPVSDESEAEAKDEGMVEGDGEQEREMWVKRVAGSEFEAKVLTSEDVWLTAFLGSPEVKGCDEKMQEWKEASGNLVGVVHIAELNATTDDEAARWAKHYGVDARVRDSKQCMGVLLFPFGEDKAEQGPELYEGSMTGKDLLAFAYDAMPFEFVQLVNSGSMDHFWQTNPRKPKVLLFSSKTEVSPLYRTLATNFRLYISFGQVHSSETELVKRFTVQKFPQLVFVLAEPSRENPDQYLMNVNHYRGPLKFAPLTEVLGQMASWAIGMEGEPDTRVDVPELVDDDGFGRHCITPGRLCVVGLFKGPSKVEDLRKVASIWVKGGQFTFSWIDTLKVPAFPSLLGVPSSALPTAVVISPVKQRIAQLTVEFSPANLQALLEGLLGKRIPTSHLEVLPSFAAAAKTEVPEETPVEEEPLVEEEFSLDDILGEEVEDGGVLGTKGQRLEEVERELLEEEAKRRAEEEAAKAAKKSSKKKKKKQKAKKGSSTKDEL